MGVREKLADWLTGGDYTARGHAYDVWRDLYIEQEKFREDLSFDLAHMASALQDISAIPVTASSNGQTRKAVRIAKEALA